MRLGTYEQYIATSRYARYLPEKKRRETWDETVGRYLGFMSKHTGIDLEFLYTPIHDMVVLPSMRAVMVSGLALERDHCASYNCAYTSVDNIRVFDEALYIMLCGTGLGYSVERQYVTKLPEVAEDFHDTDTTIVVRDSKLGWAKALRELVHLLYAGQVPKIDTLNLLRGCAVILSASSKAPQVGN